MRSKKEAIGEIRKAMIGFGHPEEACLTDDEIEDGIKLLCKNTGNVFNQMAVASGTAAERLRELAHAAEKAQAPRGGGPMKRSEAGR